MLFLIELGPSGIKFPNTPEGKQAACSSQIVLGLFIVSS